MLNIGLPELLFLLALLVVVFRPEQLAELARLAGSLAGRLRGMGQQLRDEAEREWPATSSPSEWMRSLEGPKPKEPES